MNAQRPPDGLGPDGLPPGPVIWLSTEPGQAGPTSLGNGGSPAEHRTWPTQAPAPADVLSQGRSWRWPSGRRVRFWYGGAATLGLIAGLIAVLVMLGSGGPGSSGQPVAVRSQPPSSPPPPLALQCPSLTGVAARTRAGTERTSANQRAGAELAARFALAPSSSATSGARTVDPVAGISYLAFGAPWQPWDSLWRAGRLEVPYQVGQHFVTETYSGGDYHASILSAAVPASLNDRVAIDLDCVGRQVLADVRAEYYPQPNQMRIIRAGSTRLGGRPAWVAEVRLWFDQDDLRAKSELVGLAVVDVGRTAAAVLYVSIPDTHPEWERAVAEVLASVRPT